MLGLIEDFCSSLLVNLMMIVLVCGVLIFVQQTRGEVPVVLIQVVARGRWPVKGFIARSQVSKSMPSLIINNSG